MNTQFKPTALKNRIPLLDVLRGFAITGVLFMNILYFSGFIYTPFVVLNKMPLAAFNETTIWVIFYVFLGKFYPILCYLLGAGIYMHFEKKEEPGFLKFYFRRMSFLLLIGFFHSLIWPGDVIFVYALFSFPMLLFRNLKPIHYLWWTIILMLLNFVALYFTPILFKSHKEITQIAHIHLNDLDPYELIRMVREDGFIGFLTLIKKHTLVLWNFERYFSLTFRALALIMFGAYLQSSGFLTEKLHKVKYMILFLILGLAGTALTFFVSWSFKIIDCFFLSLAFMSVLAMLLKHKPAKLLIKIMAPYGRMALTNYIMQSVIGILLFYGIGFGLYATVPLFIILIMGFVIWLFQIIFSKYWLTYFRFGPIEWIWRSLSYGYKIDNIRKKI